MRRETGHSMAERKIVKIETIGELGLINGKESEYES